MRLIILTLLLTGLSFGYKYYVVYECQNESVSFKQSTFMTSDMKFNDKSYKEYINIIKKDLPVQYKDFNVLILFYNELK